MTANAQDTPPSEPASIPRNVRIWRSAAVVATVVVIALVAYGALATWRLRQELGEQRVAAEAEIQLSWDAVQDLAALASQTHLGMSIDDDASKRLSLQTAIAYYQEFADREADEVEARVRAVQAQRAIGAVRRRLGQLDEAVEQLRKASQLAEKLATSDPDRVLDRREVAACCFELANTLREQGKWEEAEEAYEQSLDIQNLLTNQYPNDSELVSATALTMHEFAVVRKHQHQWDEARRLLDQAARLQLAPHGLSIDEARYKKRLSRHYLSLGVCLADVNFRRIEDAEEAFRQGIFWTEQVLQQEPEGIVFKYQAADAYVRLARLLAESPRKRSAAVEWAKKANAAYQELAESYPLVPSYRHEQGLTLTYLALLLENQGNREGAQQSQELATEYLETSRQIASGSASLCKQMAIGERDVAWFLNYCPDSQLLDPELAVKFAKSAVELDPDSPDNWCTLGIAYYYQSQLDDAADALTRAGELRTGGNSLEWFFLAMVHGLLDNQVARKWLNKAVEWMDRNAPNDAHLQRIRKEAEDMFRQRNLQP